MGNYTTSHVGAAGKCLAGWVFALTMVLVGIPTIHVRADVPIGKPFQSTSNDDANKLNNITTEKWFELQANARQKWKISKGKDFRKLPPEFQWDTAPTPIDTPSPVYPFERLSDKKAGKVRVYFVVGPNGLTYGAELQEATAPEFGHAVLAMLDACRFNPPLKDGKPSYAYIGSEYRLNAVLSPALLPGAFRQAQGR